MLELACNLSPTLDMDSMFVLQGLKYAKLSSYDFLSV